MVFCQSAEIQTIVPKRCDVAAFRETLAEWNRQAVKISFRARFALCFRNGDTSNHYSVIHFAKQFLQWFSSWFPSALSLTSELHRGEERCRVCLGPVRILSDDLPSVTTDGEGDT